ncbi:peptidoglycan editing factor PgeF [Desulfitobacterium sp. THU1]|uniref:peptidoglycan editing factor PgeF n=1 Tax=Desulfitobacterium sp. THU1 TaxID=3138072 RepID=UPI00311ECD40
MAWSWRQGKELVYLTLPVWESEGIQIGFSTRWGGISSSPYATLNLGLHVGDSPNQVEINRKLWFAEWNALSGEVALGEQVHGTKIHQVTERDAGRGSDSLDTVITGVDGLITVTHTALMAFFADCVPVFFYHPLLQAVGIAHAGWKGTSGKIVSEMLEMFRLRGGDPAECWAAIGPSIGPCCYEVDEHVRMEFEKSFSKTPFLKPGRQGHSQLDLQEANSMILREAGIPPEKIWIARECTACHTDSFFSHRREGPKTGRMAGWIRRLPKREE